LAETVPVSTQKRQKSEFYVSFLDGFPGSWCLVEALQHFFSSLLGRRGAPIPISGLRSDRVAATLRLLLAAFQ